MSRDNILNNLKDNISVSKFRKEKARKDKIKNALQSTFAVLLCTFSITGIVFAKDISVKVYENFWGTGNGVGHAMEQGYIEKPEMEPEVSNTVMENEETGEKVEDLETSVKVDELVMDDFNLSITFNVTLSDKALEVIQGEAKDVWEMGFPDMVIKDEEDYVVFMAPQQYKNYDLDSEKVINTGINSFLEERSGHTLKVVYNIYTGSAHFPKSKELNVKFGKINISKDETVDAMSGRGEITLTGDWDFKVDVPEKMYNRQRVEYVQKSSTNKDYTVESAIVYDTGMEVGLELKNVIKDLPENPPTTPEIEFYNSLPEDSEFKAEGNQISSYIYNKLFQSEEHLAYQKAYQEAYDVEVYLLNSDGEKFEFTMGPRENGHKHISDDKKSLSYGAMYDLTKYDMTDEITVVINKNGREDKIVLERKGE